MAKPPSAHLAHRVRVAAPANEAHHLLNGHPSRPGSRDQTRQPIEMVGRDVPPIRVSANKFHHPAPRATEDQRYRIPREWYLAGVRRPASPPILRDQVQMALELLDSGHRICLANIESGEFRRPRARAEAEFEPAAR